VQVAKKEKGKTVQEESELLYLFILRSVHGSYRSHMQLHVKMNNPQGNINLTHLTYRPDTTTSDYLI
jgi:hypothetical protein